MSICRALLVGVVCSVWTAGAIAQELSPRFYWPAPRGTRVAVFGYSYTSGDVKMDPSIPITGASSEVNTAFFAYMQTFSLWGRTTNLLIEQPYSWATAEGLVFGVPDKTNISGLNDLGITLAVNLLGAPSMTVEEFWELRENPHPILGASIKVVAPTGKYDKDKLINIGANRWAVRPELGYVIPLTPKLLLELEAGAWFFGDNDDFVIGKREQDPIYAGEVHLIRRFKPGFWASLEAAYFEGGQQTIGGNQLVDVQRNMKIGSTVVLPIRLGQAIKVGYSTGVITEFGDDFDQFIMSYTMVF
jgi:hypothetical protein